MTGNGLADVCQVILVVLTIFAGVAAAWAWRLDRRDVQEAARQEQENKSEGNR